MKTAAQSLKNTLKKLSVLQSDFYVLDGEKIYATAPNLTLAVELKSDLGICAVGAQKFSQLIARLEGDIELHIIHPKLCIRSSKSKLALPLIAEPRVPKYTIPTNCTQLAYRETIDALNYALQATESGSMFNYTGTVQLSKEYAAGSDGKRLAVCSVLNGPANPLLLPVATVQALKALEGDALSISEDETNLYFQAKDATLVARKLAKMYPDFSKLLPKELNYKYLFNREELRNALRGLAPLVEDRINLTMNSDSCILSLDSKLGSGVVNIAAEQITPDPLFDTPQFSGNFTFSHILDFVESVNADVLFGANNEKGPVLLESGKYKLIMGATR